MLRDSGKYIAALLGAALELREGDELVVLLPAEYIDFGEQLKAEALRRGAVRVYLNYEDESARYRHYAEGNTEPCRWLNEETFEEPARQGAKMLLLISPQLGLFETLPKEQYELCMTHYYLDAGIRGAKILRDSSIAHTAAMLPNMRWARALFPELNDTEAFYKLWDAMRIALYLDKDDPEAYWRSHSRELRERAESLTGLGFEALHITGRDTDILFKLPESHIWIGGTMESANGCVYIPQLPTEEVFTTPRRDGVEGGIEIRTGSSFGGIRTEGLHIELTGGRLKSLTAQSGKFAEALLKKIGENEGGDRLGEIALVTGDSGVKSSDCFFCHNLFDENKCSHLAFGHAYRFTLPDGESMSDEEFLSHGGNVCSFHYDIMFDSESMSICGVKNGVETPIMTKGKWSL